MSFSLEGKNAWITGASYGIGFNIAPTWPRRQTWANSSSGTTRHA